MVPARLRRALGLVVVTGLALLACGGGDDEAIAEDEFVASCISLGRGPVGPADLCVTSVEDGVTTTLLEDIEEGVAPALSPSRRRIAVVKDERIVVVAGDGTEEQSLDGPAISVAWLGGWTLIVNRGTTDTGFVIDRVSIDGRPAATVAAGDDVGGELERHIAVAPATSSLAYAVRTGKRSDLVVSSLRCGDRRVVLSSEEFIQYPAWSPDGDRLVVVVGEDLRMVDVDDGIDEPFASGPEALGTPTWSPDGRFVLFVDARGVVVGRSVEGGDESSVVDVTADLDARSFPALPTWS